MADISLVGDTLRLDSLVARARGPMRASGTVDLSDPSHPFVRMSASGEDVRVMNQRRGLVDADAEITAVGPLDALRVTGRGEMLRRLPGAQAVPEGPAAREVAWRSVVLHRVRYHRAAGATAHAPRLARREPRRSR